MNPTYPKLQLRRRFLFGLTSLLSVLPFQTIGAVAFVPSLVGRSVLRSVIRNSGRTSRGARTSQSRRASSVYHHVPTRESLEMDRARRKIMAEKLNAAQKQYIKDSVTLKKNDLPYINEQDKRKLIENFKIIIDRIETLNEVKDLLDFISKFDNPYNAVFSLAKEELDNNSELKKQFSWLIEGVDLVEAQLVFDENLEIELRRMANPFINF